VNNIGSVPTPIKKIGTKVQWLIDNVVVHEETLPNTGSLYYDVAFMTINGSFTDMEIVYDASVLNYLYCLLLHMPNHRKI
jgi:hypothetical protein